MVFNKQTTAAKSSVSEAILDQGLNAAMLLHKNGTLKKYNIELIGANAEAIDNAEDRQKFKKNMNEIGLESAKSAICHSMDEAKQILQEIPLPSIIRPSFTLGGTGGGVANTEEEYFSIVKNGLALDRKSTRLNSSHPSRSRMPSSA